MLLNIGDKLPEAASVSRPNIAGQPYAAASISLIVHPKNPYIPTCHMNLRFFSVGQKKETWHFGGGYDLTPIYGFIEDVEHWHRTGLSRRSFLLKIKESL